MKVLATCLLLCVVGFVSSVPHNKKSLFFESEIEKIDQGVSVENIICPDGQSTCPDGSTCCQMASGQWGCCPLPKATCCSDHTHCCPNGYTCDVKAGKCLQGDHILDWVLKTPAKGLSGENIICPDGQSTCPDGSTCCQMASGQWGCCPLPKATCCSDHTHCCPNGYTCDVKAGKCLQGDHVLDWVLKTPAKVEKVDSIVCPDGRSTCADGSTCCQMASGQWGCCALPKATCCSDHVHCCPHGFTCDIKAGMCRQGETTVAWLEKLPAQVSEEAAVVTSNDALTSVVCPGGTSSCPDGYTCCQLASGQWGCCPYVQAVCCSDHIHCCPNGYTCDLQHQQCMSKTNISPLLRKQPAKTLAPSSKTVTCPGGTTFCPDKSSCCRLNSGAYGCCPYPNAVCCRDNLHCCPHDYTCNPSAGTCEKGWVKLPLGKP